MAGNRTSEPLRGAFIAILAAAIGAGGTLLGNAIASANARDQLVAQFAHDNRVRQVDLRREVYEKFITAASQYQSDIVRLTVLAAGRQSNLKTILKVVTGDSAQMLTLLSEVQVVGSANAASLARAVRNDLDDIAFSDHLSPEQTVDRANKNKDKLQLFVNAVRTELNSQGLRLSSLRSCGLGRTQDCLFRAAGQHG